ncbi:hypothetical protein BDV10DRAFT_34570 [Aspergillus recurvatus]
MGLVSCWPGVCFLAVAFFIFYFLFFYFVSASDFEFLYSPVYLHIFSFGHHDTWLLDGVDINMDGAVFMFHCPLVFSRPLSE